MAVDVDPFTHGAVPVPNRLFDELLPTLNDTQLRVLLVVVRATLGWREGSDRGGWRYKRRDWLSHAQLQRRTGRGSEAVSAAVAHLVAQDLVIVESAAGIPLSRSQERRAHLGRLYYGLGAVWTSAAQPRPGKSKTTTVNRYEHLQRQRRGGWQRAASVAGAARAGAVPATPCPAPTTVVPGAADPA